jgi:hypothetical protein
MLTMWHRVSAKVGTNFATSGSRSVGLVRSRTQGTDFLAFFFIEITFN